MLRPPILVSERQREHVISLGTSTLSCPASVSLPSGAGQEELTKERGGSFGAPLPCFGYSGACSGEASIT